MRRFGRRRSKHGRHEQHDFDLQITSLADILIIVLVFLLKSYSTGVNQEINVPSGIKLPVISLGNIGKEGIKIEISRTFVQIEGRKVASLSEGKFSGEDLNGDLSKNGSSQSLIAALKEEKKTRDPKEASSIWIVADQTVPYRTIQTVLASAAINGFQDFNLAVVKDQ